uniref:G-protein coupled receptors family 1 profile domain-containing protein n=1 Tax=Anguilla anguilla TaxID=7936 RepID=A0A0E9SNE3_ANGAN
MASLNSCINPMALYFVSKKFKNCFQSCLCCWCQRSARNIINADERASGICWKGYCYENSLDRQALTPARSTALPKPDTTES